MQSDAFGGIRMRWDTSGLFFRIFADKFEHFRSFFDSGALLFWTFLRVGGLLLWGVLLFRPRINLITFFDPTVEEKKMAKTNWNFNERRSFF